MAASKVSFKAKSIHKPYDLWYIPEEPGFNTGTEQTNPGCIFCLWDFLFLFSSSLFNKMPERQGIFCQGMLKGLFEAFRSA